MLDSKKGSLIVSLIILPFLIFAVINGLLLHAFSIWRLVLGGAGIILLSGLYIIAVRQAILAWRH